MYACTTALFNLVSVATVSVVQQNVCWGQVADLFTVVSCRSRIKIDALAQRSNLGKKSSATWSFWSDRGGLKHQTVLFKSINNIWAQPFSLVYVCVSYSWRTERMKEHLVCVVISYESSKNLNGLFKSFSRAGLLWWKWMRWGLQIYHYATDK